MFKLSPRKILCYLWVALLAFSFYISVRSSYRQSLSTEEYAYACDPFGYLRMARQIRHAVSRGAWPEFKIESAQTRSLINFMQQTNLPVRRWEEVVGPHAHHYFPKSGYVGVQYPPGTGLALAMFPQGEAVYRLNRIVVFVFVAMGIGALLIAAWKQAWASIGLVVLALSLGLMVLARVGFLSFSINAVLVPILLTCLLSIFALGCKTAGRDRLALLSALLAGLFLGFATLIRLPSFLLLPGFLVLLWPGFRNVRVKSLPVAFVLGVVVTGIIPVLINQQEVAGAWYLSTYAGVDAAPPGLQGLKANLSYFLGSGEASVDNWALLYALIGFAGFLLLKRDSGQSNHLGLTWQRLALAAFLIWFVSICFFLTHWVVAPHYMIPSVFAAVALIGFGAFGMEATSTVVQRFNPRSVVSLVALVLILWPGLATLNRVWSNRQLEPAPERAMTHAPILLPSELVDDKAWVWADLLTGSLWYYASKPAFKIDKTDAQVRAMIYRWVFERGERQYLIQDSEQMKQYMGEIEQLGGKSEMRGKIDGQPYFLVAWPSSGPSPERNEPQGHKEH
jgi:MFS family permease